MHPRFSTITAAYRKIAIAIFVLACGLYANTIPNKWAVDDSLIIYGNRYVQRGINGIDSLATQDAFAGFFGGNKANMVAGGRWRPLTHILFAIEAELFASPKKDANLQVQKDSAGFTVRDIGEDSHFPHLLHFFNMLWYGLLCVLLYYTLVLLLNPFRNTEKVKENFVAAVATLLFTLHPLHTEVVANVKGTDEIFSLLGSLAALYCLLKAWYAVNTGNKNSKIKWWIAATLVFFSALLSKENAATYLAVIPLALWFFTTAKAKSIALLMLPLIGAFLLFWAFRSAVLYQPVQQEITEELMNDPFLILDEHAQYAPLVPGSSIQKLVNPDANTFTQMPATNKLATNLYTYGIYLKLLIAPFSLTVDYYPRQVAVKSFADGGVWLSLLIHLTLLLWALRHLKSKNPLAFGILYYFITFSISANLFFPIGTSMAERFMFMPSVGFCLCMALLLHRIVAGKSSLVKTYNLPSISGCTALAIICLFFGIRTLVRNTDWKDNFTLFSHDINVSENSGKIKTDLATLIIDRANQQAVNELQQLKMVSNEEKEIGLKNIYQTQTNNIQEAIPLLQQALEIHPMSNAAWLQLGNAYHLLGQNKNAPAINALLDLQKAVAAFEQADYYKGAGMAQTVSKAKAATYMSFGRLMGEQFRDSQSAVAFLEKARVLDSANATVYYLLGTAYTENKAFEKAIDAIQKSLQLQPGDKEAVENLAAVYLQYATANASHTSLIDTASKLLHQQAAINEKLADNDPDKKIHSLRILTLLQRVSTLQGDTAQQHLYTFKINNLNSNVAN